MSKIQVNDITVYETIKLVLSKAREKAYSAVNLAMVEAYWNIGRIVCEAQGAHERAEYGEYLIKNLSKKLTEEFGKGFTVANLKNMRQFYSTFKNGYALRSQLSWTHYRLLMRIEKDDVRSFYLEECIRNNWSTRQLERQINSFYYERILSSQDKDVVRQEIRQLEPGLQPEDIVKDPFVLEFLNLKENQNYLEKDLEKGLVDNLQAFLLELGKGFSFVARQKRITADGDHFYIDLVFYNYVLKCFVLIDLKVGKLTHQDIGQMDFYVRYFEKEIKHESDNPTIGIILCSEKNETIVKYSVLEESRQLFASKYMLYLPTEEELGKELKRERQFLEIEGRLAQDNKDALR
jgi:predicted nuclease of restriction endonuclease-like (RecB) superfamily